MNQLRGFPSWLVFAIVSSPDPHRVAVRVETDLHPEIRRSPHDIGAGQT
jgi:hypothetical protein